jgi:cytochrome c biogenesis protein CcmG, thiol:disulfide interchange protein DsbE
VKLKIVIVAALVLILALGGYFSIRHRPPASLTGEPRLDRILRSKAVSGLPLTREIPKYILVNFWASWCGPCFEETPSLIRFAKAHKQDFLFLSVSQDTSEKEFNAFMKAFPDLLAASDLLVLDRGQVIGRSYQIEKLPESLVYSPRLKKYFHISGSVDWSRPDVLSQIEKGLPPPPAAMAD